MILILFSIIVLISGYALCYFLFDSDHGLGFVGLVLGCLLLFAMIQRYDYSKEIADFKRAKEINENSENIDASFKLRIIELNLWLGKAQKENQHFLIDDLIPHSDPARCNGAAAGVEGVLVRGRHSATRACAAVRGRRCRGDCRG